MFINYDRSKNDGKGGFVFSWSQNASVKEMIESDKPIIEQIGKDLGNNGKGLYGKSADEIREITDSYKEQYGQLSEKGQEFLAVCSKQEKHMQTGANLVNDYTEYCSKGFNKATFSAKAFNKVAQIGNTLLSMGIAMLASWLISSAINVISTLVNKQKNLNEALKEHSQAVDDLNKKHQTNTKTIKDLNDEYKSLSKGVDGVGNNISLTADEYDRYHEISNQVAELMPDLVKGWDEQGNAILKVKGALADLNAEYRKTKQQESYESYNEETDNPPWLQLLDIPADTILRNNGFDPDRKANQSYINAATQYKSSVDFNLPIPASYTSRGKGSENYGSVSQDEFLSEFVDALANGTFDKDIIGKYSSYNVRDFSKLSEDERQLYAVVSELKNIIPEIGTLYQDGEYSNDDWREIQNKAREYATTQRTKQRESNRIIAQDALQYLDIYLSTKDDGFNNTFENRNGTQYLSALLNNMSSEFQQKFLYNPEDARNFVSRFADMIVNTSPEQSDKLSNLFQELFSIDFDKTDLSPKKIQEKINSILIQIYTLLNNGKAPNGEELKNFKIQLGVDVSDNVVKKYDTVVNEIVKRSKAAGKAISKNTVEKFMNKASINTEEKLDNWLKIFRKVINKGGSFVNAESKYLKSVGKSYSIFDKDAKVERLQKKYDKLSKQLEDGSSTEKKKSKNVSKNTSDEKIGAYNQPTGEFASGWKNKISSMFKKIISGKLENVDNTVDKTILDSTSELLENQNKKNSFLSKSKKSTTLTKIKKSIASMFMPKWTEKEEMSDEERSQKERKRKKISDELVATRQAIKDEKFTEEWSALDNIKTDDADKTDDKYKDLKKNLLDAAEAGNLTTDSFKKIDGASDWAKKLGIGVDELVGKINRLSSETKKLQSLKTAIGSIRDAYAEKKDNKVVGADKIASMEDTFGKLGKAWKKYKQVAGSNKTTLKQLKKAQNDLATAYVNSKEFLSGLIDDTGKCTEANKEYYISQLKELGIKNAEDVVNQSIVKEQVNLKLSTYDLTDATEEETTKLGEELDVITKGDKKLKQYAYQKALASKKSLSTAKSVKNLRILAEQCGITGDAISDLTKLEKLKDEYEGLSANAPAMQKSVLEAQMNTIEKKLKKDSKKVATDVGTDTSVDVDTSKLGDSSSKDKSSSTKSKTEFDWIERKVDVLNSKISLLNAKKENIFSVKNKNKNLDKQIKETTKLIDTYTVAIKRYSEKANSIKLSNSLKEKVRNGQITGTYKQLIQKYGEKTANLIEDYKNYIDKVTSSKQSLAEAKTNKRSLQEEQFQNLVDKYDARSELYSQLADDTSKSAKKRNSYINKEQKALKNSYTYQKAIADLNHNTAESKRLQAEYEQKMVELNKTKFDNITDEYEKKLKNNEYEAQNIDNAIERIEARGQKANISYYEKQKKINADNKKIYKDELKSQENALKNIKKGTQEYYDARDAIQETKNKISECTKAQAEWNTKIREARNELANNIQTQLSRVNSEQELLRSLFAHEKNFDTDTGTITKAGIANLGSLATSYYTSLIASDETNKRLNELLEAKEKGTWKKLNYDSIDQLEEDIDKLYDTRKSNAQEVYKIESSIAEIIKNSYNAQLDALKKMSDKLREQLKDMKDLHDYQRTILEKTNSINDVRRQIAAYSGDTSQEGLARLQKLQKELVDKQDDLNETEFDRYISAQESMLDKLFEQFQELINKKLDEFMKLVKKGLNVAENNTEVTNDYLEEVASDNDYTPQYPRIADEKSTEETAKGLINNETKKSGTVTTTPSVDKNTSKSISPIITDKNGNIYNRNNKKDMKDYVLWFIGEYAKSTKKKTSELSYINKMLYSDGTKKLGSFKKILTTAKLKELAAMLGIVYDNETQDGSLAKKFHKIGIPGFSTGGFVSIDDIEKQIRRNGDDSLASVKSGEAILTSIQTKSLADNLDELRFATSLMQKYASIPNTFTNVKGNNGSHGDIDNSIGEVNIEINVERADNPDDLIKAIQNSPKVQKALASVSVGRLKPSNSTRLNVRSIK